MTYDLGFIGRLVEQKQPLRFIDIVERLRERLPNVCALMIGEGELRQEVEKAIAAHGLERCVFLAGFLSNPFPALAKCKMIVMPSAWEGFGLVAVEGMALGTPVLAAPVGGLKEIVDERSGKLCVAVTEFVDEAITLLTNPQLYAGKSRAAKERAESYANGAAYCDEIENIYNDILTCK